MRALFFPRGARVVVSVALSRAISQNPLKTMEVRQSAAQITQTQTNMFVASLCSCFSPHCRSGLFHDVSSAGGILGGFSNLNVPSIALQ